MRTRIAHLATIGTNNSGNAIVEFAIVLPVFLFLIFGVFNIALMLFASASMQNATQAGARCASINSATCGSAAATVAYAQTKFVASSTARPAFTVTTAACGHLVSANMNYVFDIGVTHYSVPLTSTSCYP